MPAVDIELRGRESRVAQTFNLASQKAGELTDRLTAGNAVAARFAGTIGRLGPAALGVGAGLSLIHI